MRIKKGFQLRSVGEEKVIIAHGLENIDFGKIISMNASAVWIWEQVKEKEFSVEMVADMLVSHYTVDKETAMRDVKDLLGSWLNVGIVEE